MSNIYTYINKYKINLYVKCVSLSLSLSQSLGVELVPQCSSRVI